MKLDKEKELASRALGIGKKRIWFNPARLADISEAITRQDIKDLLKDKAIKIKTVTGRLKNEKRKRRGKGKIRKQVQKRKREYIIRIRKFRKYLKMLKNNHEINLDDFSNLRRQIKSGIFASLRQLKEFIASTKKAEISGTKPKEKKSEKNNQKKSIKK